MKDQPSPVARDISYRAINLPSYHEISTQDIQKVTRIVGRLSLQRGHRLKLLILADGAVGKRVFDWLAAEWLSDVSLLVTTGEGALKTEAERLGIPVVTFLSDAQVVRDCVELGVEPDLGLLAWWPKLIGTALLNLPVAGS